MALGATAVLVACSWRRRSRGMDRIGPAHGEAGLVALKGKVLRDDYGDLGQDRGEPRQRD